MIDLVLRLIFKHIFFEQDVRIGSEVGGSRRLAGFDNHAGHIRSSALLSLQNIQGSLSE